MECVECAQEEKLDVELKVYTRWGCNNTSVKDVHTELRFNQSGTWRGVCLIGFFDYNEINVHTRFLINSSVC